MPVPGWVSPQSSAGDTGPVKTKIRRGEGFVLKHVPGDRPYGSVTR